ncbi:MAG: hypothetical protein V3T55_05170, partial [Anaerolineales bacterium]
DVLLLDILTFFNIPLDSLWADLPYCTNVVTFCPERGAWPPIRFSQVDILFINSRELRPLKRRTISASDHFCGADSNICT